MTQCLYWTPFTMTGEIFVRTPHIDISDWKQWFRAIHTGTDIPLPRALRHALWDAWGELRAGNFYARLSCALIAPDTIRFIWRDRGRKCDATVAIPEGMRPLIRTVDGGSK